MPTRVAEVEARAQRRWQEAEGLEQPAFLIVSPAVRALRPFSTLALRVKEVRLQLAGEAGEAQHLGLPES